VGRGRWPRGSFPPRLPADGSSGRGVTHRAARRTEPLCAAALVPRTPSCPQTLFWPCCLSPARRRHSLSTFSLLVGGWIQKPAYSVLVELCRLRHGFGLNTKQGAGSGERLQERGPVIRLISCNAPPVDFLKDPFLKWQSLNFLIKSSKMKCLITTETF